MAVATEALPTLCLLAGVMTAGDKGMLHACTHHARALPVGVSEAGGVQPVIGLARQCEWRGGVKGNVAGHSIWVRSDRGGSVPLANEVRGQLVGQSVVLSGCSRSASSRLEKGLACLASGLSTRDLAWLASWCCATLLERVSPLWPEKKTSCVCELWRQVA